MTHFEQTFNCSNFDMCKVCSLKPLDVNENQLSANASVVTVNSSDDEALPDPLQYSVCSCDCRHMARFLVKVLNSDQKFATKSLHSSSCAAEDCSCHKSRYPEMRNLPPLLYRWVSDCSDDYVSIFAKLYTLSEARQVFDHLIQCRCCERHQLRKPTMFK